MSSYNDLPARFVPVAAWPGERTRNRQKSRFNSTVGSTVDLLKRELREVGAKNILIQLECDESEIRRDGYPRADARVQGPGVIVTFDCKHGTLSYPCDRYPHWNCNLRAIALSLEALRAVDRHGVTRRGEQYTGWKQLGSGIQPAMSTAQAAEFLVRSAGAQPGAFRLTSRDEVTTYYRTAARLLHPDAGGSTTEFQRLQEAKRVLDQHFNGAR